MIPKTKLHVLSLLLPLLLAAKLVAATENYISTKLPTLDSIPPIRQIGVQIQASISPSGNIITSTGKYHLQSRLQSLFGAGVNYQLNFDNYLSLIYGVQINLLSTNYYLHIPDSDLSGFLSTGGAPQIEDKQVYYKIAFPVMLSYRFLQKVDGYYSLNAGFKVNYSGFSPDENTSTQIADTNYKLQNIFTGKFSSDNNKKPWVTFCAGVARSVHLNSTGDLSIGLMFELSLTKFIKGNYTITVPNQPVTTGSYTVKGSCAGISLLYILPKHERKDRIS